MLYPKSDGVPTHWPRQISCLMLHMSTHPRELSGEELTSTIEGVSPEELTLNEQGSAGPGGSEQGPLSCSPSASRGLLA